MAWPIGPKGMAVDEPAGQEGKGLFSFGFPPPQNRHAYYHKMKTVAFKHALMAIVCDEGFVRGVSLLGTSGSNRRWYDQEPSCSRVLEQIRGMPQPEIREFCARVLIHFADKLRRELQNKDKKLQGVNSIGVPAISSLYRFGYQKRRWYDEDPVLHKAVATFYTLPLEGLGLVGFKLGDTFGLIQVYSVVCSEVDQPPSLADMAKICTTSLQTGPKEAREILVSIVGEDLYNSLGALTLDAER